MTFYCAIEDCPGLPYRPTESPHPCGLSLTNTLKALGFSHRRNERTANTQRHDIFDPDGNFVRAMTPGEVWMWLREQGLHPAMKEK